MKTVLSFKKHYLSFEQFTGILGNHFQESHGMKQDVYKFFVIILHLVSM